MFPTMTPPGGNAPPLSVTQLRIVLFALLAGLIAFGGFAIATAPTPGADANQDRILMFAVLAVAAAEIPAYVLLRSILIGGVSRKTLDEPDGDHQPHARHVYLMLTLIGAALAEGVGLFAIIVFMITGHVEILAVALLSLILIAIQIPSEHRAERFVEHVTGRMR